MAGKNYLTKLVKKLAQLNLALSSVEPNESVVFDVVISQRVAFAKVLTRLKPFSSIRWWT